MKKQHKIPAISPHSSYYKGWLELYDGGSGTWLYVCRDGLTYVFLEVIDMVDACGSDATELFCASVDVVDLANTPPETMVQAIRCCGAEDDPPNMTTESGRLAMAEMLHQYGAKSPCWSESGGKVTESNRFDSPGENHPAFRHLRAEARRFAESTLLDESSRDELLDTKIVNKIGQTAREFAGGTEALWDTLRRIQEAGDEATHEQKIVLRMYQSAGTTLGAGPVPRDIAEG